MRILINSQRIRLALSAYLCFSMIFSPFIPVAGAQVVVDPSGGSAKVINVGGVDVIQINAPTSSGVSHNKFTEYNVPDQGLILNNSNLNQYDPNSKSQLNGEHVEFNLNFKGGDTARIILNEVTGNNRTMMSGTTEVYGNQADLIIANPNGISCVGCGFINVDKLSMIAGTPNVVGGAIRDYNIMPMGIVEVNGLGEQRFAVNTVNSAVLVADMVRLAGDISVYGDLSVLTGNNKYNPNTNAVSSVNSAIKPSVAIDAYALGAMQAGTIRLYASQTGLGINVEKGSVASAKGLQITADGDIVFKNLAANETIDITSGSGVISQTQGGTITGNEDVNMNGGVALAGTTNVAQDLTVHGRAVTLSGRVESGRDVNISGTDMSLSGTVLAENDVTINGTEIDISGKYIAAKNIDVAVVGNMNASGELQASDNISLQTGNLTAGNIQAGSLDITSGGNITFDGENIIADTINVIGANITNKSILLSSNSDITAYHTLNNQGLFVINDTNGKGIYNAQFIRNYGSFKSAGDLEFNTKWDQINYDNSSILAAGNIFFQTGRDFVNYKSEIYAGQNITFTGIDGFLAAHQSNLGIKGGKEDITAYYGRYKNPYGGNIPEFIVLPDVQPPAMSDPMDDVNAYFYITDTEDKLFFEDIAFGEDSALGDSFTVGDYTIYIGREVVKTSPVGEYTEFEFDENDESSFFTVKKNDTAVAFEIRSEGDTSTIGDDSDNGNYTAPPVANNSGSKPTPELKAHEKLYGYVFQTKSDASNSLLNIAGTIESGGDISINTSYLKNIGIDFSNNANGSTLYDYQYYDTGANGGWYNWQLAGYNYITRTYLDTEGAVISAGGNMTVSSKELYNFGSTVAAKGTLEIKSAHLINETSHKSVDLQAYYKERGYRGWTRVLRKRIGYGSKTSTKWESMPGSFYSARSALILGDYVKVSSNKITNDQAENVTNALIVRNQTINTNHDSVFTVPEGRNGLFTVVNNSRWLVQGDYLILDPSRHLGGDYFFEEAGLDNNNKLLGDPAYETKLVMQQIRDQTYQHYLDNEGSISSDYEQMKRLYDNAVRESKDLGLKVGVALTDDQIKQLKSSILWYEYREVNGETVLVPKLYMAFVTGEMVAQKKTETGNSVIAGNSVAIEAGELNNSGAIYGSDSVTIAAETVNNDSKLNHQAVINSGGTTIIEADLVHNKSGFIGGVNTLVDAETIINETKKYTQDLTLNEDLVDKKEFAGFTAEIAADSMLQIEGDTLHSIGGKLSSGGNALIDVDEATFDALELNSLSITNTESEEIGGSTTTHEEIRTTTHQGSKIDVAGNLQLMTERDATFRGAEVSVGGNALLDIGGDLRIENVYDSYSRDYSRESSSYGGLEGAVDIEQTVTQTVNDSKFDIAGDLVTLSGGDTVLIGSGLDTEAGNISIYTGYELNEDGDLVKTGTGGSLYELEAHDYSYEYEYHEKTNFIDGLKNIALSVLVPGSTLFNDDIEFGYSRGKFNASMTLGEQTVDSVETIKNTAVKSMIDAGGNLSIVSDGDVNIQGSELLAGGDMAVSATDDINITAAQNIETVTEEHESTVISTTATVGNAYVDAGYAAYGLIEAGKAVEDATSALKAMEDLYAEGKATSGAVNDAKANLAMATANLANATIAAAASVASAAAAGSSSFGTGIYANAGLSMDTSTDALTTQKTSSTGSTVAAGGNISFSAGGDMLQSGSDVLSSHGDIAYNIKNDLRLDATKNTSSSKQSTETASVSVTVGNNAVSGSANASTSESESSDTNYTNATTSAKEGTITYNVGGDMMGTGYNADGKHIVGDIKGDLVLTSLQAEGNNSNSSTSVGISVGSGSAGGNFGMSDGSGDYQQTQVSSILGSESVDITVGGKLNLTGSAIANAEMDEEGNIINDRGNLNLVAGSIEYEDLKDYSENKQTGFNVGTNISGGGDKPVGGTTTIGMTNTGSETEGTTHATIGNGTITVNDGSDISSLNRDVANMQETTKDLVTGALDGSVTVDNRLFSDAGQESILSDFENLDRNLGRIKDNIVSSNIVVQSIKNAATDENTNIIEAVKDYIDLDDKMDQIQADKELTAKANGLTNSEDAEALEESLQGIADIANEDANREVELSLTDQAGGKGYAAGEVGGDSLDVGVDIKETDISKSGEVINVIFHETTKLEDHKASEQTAQNRGNTANEIWDMKNYANANTNGDTTGSDWYNAKGQGSLAVGSGNSIYQNNLNNYRNNPDDYIMEGWVPIVLEGIDKALIAKDTYDLSQGKITPKEYAINIAADNLGTGGRLGKEIIDVVVSSGKWLSGKLRGLVGRNADEVAGVISKNADEVVEGVSQNVDEVVGNTPQLALPDKTPQLALPDKTGRMNGVPEDANYAQKTYSPNFSDKGNLAGRTVVEVVEDLKTGRMTVDDLPIEIIYRDGKPLILNTRSSQALTEAGIPRSQWKSIDRTGYTDAEGRLTGQLERNGLDSNGINSPKVTGKK